MKNMLNNKKNEKSQIVILDYGMGNLRSVLYRLTKLSTDVIISNQKEDIKKASKLILPGVGHFAAGMKNLQKYDIIEILNDRVLHEKIPILGICLGVQLFSNYSEEGNVEGLGWIDAETKRFNFNGESSMFRVPHMGWNSILIQKEHSLLKNVNYDDLFYFVHSYHVVCKNNDDILTITNYGINFISSIQKENIFGTQFHPEKSHDAGAQILKNFIESI